MWELINWYKENMSWKKSSWGISKIHPALFASEFHYKFVKIHPFIDWNWRTIRILVNMILMKLWYPMIIIPPVRRLEYISTLNSTSNLNDFNLFILDIIYINIQDYLRMISSD